MKEWEQFEFDCEQYLKQTFGEYADFSLQGGSDSSHPDILVKTIDNTFYIEVKSANAQCGQFVLLPDNTSNSFIYSPRNHSVESKSAVMIKKHMNSMFEDYCNAGTRGKEIVMKNDQEIFSEWIIGNYKLKNVFFIITENNTILPIDRIKEYFTIKATYRIKNSGSSNVGKKNIPIVKTYLSNNNYNIVEFRENGAKLFISSLCDYTNQKFDTDGNTYMFAKRGNEHEIRKLSDTKNANVIFSIALKSGIEGLSYDQFVSTLKK